jgi:hypothetical protein
LERFARAVTIPYNRREALKGSGSKPRGQKLREWQALEHGLPFERFQLKAHRETVKGGGKPAPNVLVP